MKHLLNGERYVNWRTRETETWQTKMYSCTEKSCVGIVGKDGILLE